MTQVGRRNGDGGTGREDPGYDKGRGSGAAGYPGMVVGERFPCLNPAISSMVS